MEIIVKVIAIAVSIFFTIVFVSAFFSIFGTIAWNYVMPEMFGLKTITFSQFFCLSFVCGLLIKSINYNSKD